MDVSIAIVHGRQPSSLTQLIGVNLYVFIVYRWFGKCSFSFQVLRTVNVKRVFFAVSILCPRKLRCEM